MIQIQPASIDLRLGDYAYPVGTSFLPGSGMKVLEKMKRLDDRFDDFKIDIRNGAVLEKGRIYVIPLLESINLRSEVAAFANPKSSTGRLDILTRMIADEATIFDQVKEGYKGELYIEVAPRSFSVVVKTGSRLNQLRFRRTRGEAPNRITSTDWQKPLDEGQVVDFNDREKKVGQAQERRLAIHGGLGRFWRRWGPDRIQSKKTYQTNRSGETGL